MIATISINSHTQKICGYIKNTIKKYCPSSQKMISSIRDTLKNSYTFKAYNNQCIAQETERNKNLSLLSKCKLGVSEGLETVKRSYCCLISEAYPIIGSLASFYITKTPPHSQPDRERESNQSHPLRIKTSSMAIAIPALLALNFGLTFFENTYANQPKTEEPPSLFKLLKGTCAEELIFREIFQNNLPILQRASRFFTPQNIQNTRIFQWFNSPAAKIAITSGLFAALHLLNAGTYLSTKSAIQQTVAAFLTPTFSVLYETTGSIIAPLFAHTTNNLAVYIILNLRKQISSQLF